MTHPFLSPTFTSQTPQGHSRQTSTFATPHPDQDQNHSSNQDQAPDPRFEDDHPFTPPLGDPVPTRERQQYQYHGTDLPPSALLNPSPSPPKAKHTRGPTRYEKEQIALGIRSKAAGGTTKHQPNAHANGNEHGVRQRPVRADSARAAGEEAGVRPMDRKVLGEWRLGKIIGKGASGQVKFARHMRTGQYAAVKIIPRSTSLSHSAKYADLSLQDWHRKMEKARLTLEREIVIMKLIQHPNVMGLYEVFEFDGVLFLVLEHIAGGELFDYLVNSSGHLHPDEASHYFQQIIRGLDYCHSFNISHRDLKPENILLDADRNIKIADFGMAAMESQDRKLETSCGSPHYASPEIVSGSSYHGNQSDIWSCGVVLYALLCGTLPFDDPDIHVLLLKVRRGTYHMPKSVPPDAADLLRRILVVKPEDRITMKEIMRHPFFFRKFDTGGPVLPIVNPPQLEDLAHPIDARVGIESEILTNLIALCQGQRKEEIIAALVCPNKTIEKAFYWLLIKNREKKLENFESEQAAEERFRAERDLKRAAKAAKLASGVDVNTRVIKDGNGVYNKDGQAIRQAPIAPARPTKQQQPTIRAAPRSPGRPAPPEGGRPALSNGSPTLPATPQTPSRIPGPRSPRSPRANKQEAASPIVTADALLRGIITSPNPSSRSGVKKQQQQENNGDLKKGSMGPPSTIRQVPPPPPMRRQSTLGLGLGISIEEETSRIARDSQIVPGAQQREVLETLTDATHAETKHDGAALSAQLLLSPDLRSLRFEALPESQPTPPRRNPSPSFGISNSPMSRFIRRGSDENAPPTEPVAQKIKTSWFGGSRTTLGDASGIQNGNNADGSSGTERRRSVKLGRQKSEIKKRRPMSMVADAKTSAMTLDGAPMSPPLPQMSVRAGGVPAPLDMSVVSRSIAGPMTSPLLPYQENDGHQGWFGTKLFNWAPATCTYISYNDCDSTREECSRLLSSFGATVILQDSEDTKMLKCNLENVRDVNGINMNKPVRFRVEVYPYSAIQGKSIIGDDLGPSTGLVPQAVVHSTSLTLTQERGAHTTFKAVHTRLREEWRLDTQLRTPSIGTEGFAIPR